MKPDGSYRYNGRPEFIISVVLPVRDIEEFTLGLAREAGELIRRERLEADLTHAYKQGTELVTSADLKADKLIVSRLRERFADHRLISEESTPEEAANASLDTPVWIIDPIDGTVNYAHGHNQSAVCIAYADGGQVQLGVVFNPFTDEMFAARRGAGATLNGKALAVSGETRLERAIIATGFPYKKEGLDAMVERLRRILHNCADVRRLGSAALDICWLAAGRLDGYYESLSLWDFAAARLVAEEAGASCGHFSTVPEGINPEVHPKDLLIATPALYEQLHELLQSA